MNMNKSSSRNSDTSIHMDSTNSALQSPSHQSDAVDIPGNTPYLTPEYNPDTDNSKAIVTVNKYDQYSSHVSMWQDQQSNNTQAKTPRSMFLNKRDEIPPSTTKVGPVTGVSGGEQGGHRGSRSLPSIRRSPRKEDVVNNAALGFRVSEFVLCLISFSVMAADRTQGWAGDSFDRYKEYRSVFLNLNIYFYQLLCY